MFIWFETVFKQLFIITAGSEDSLLREKNFKIYEFPEKYCCEIKQDNSMDGRLFYLVNKLIRAINNIIHLK